MTQQDMIASLFSQGRNGITSIMGDAFTVYTAIFGILLLIYGASVVIGAIRGGVEDETGFIGQGSKKGAYLDDRFDTMDLTSGYGEGKRSRNSSYDDSAERGKRANWHSNHVGNPHEQD